MRTKPHAVFPELRTAFLIDGLDLVGHRIALQDAEILAQAEGNALRKPGDLLGLRDFLQRLQAHVDVMAEPGLDARRDVVLVDGRQVLVGEQR